MNGTATRISEGDVIHSAATSLLEVVGDLGVAMARHIHEEIAELGGVDDEPALESTRRSCEGNVREIFSMLRAGLPATAHETPTEALAYARFMRDRGVGLAPFLRAYQFGVAMFQPVVRDEIVRRVDGSAQLEAVLERAQAFLWVYIDRVTERLAGEYGSEHQHWLPTPEDPVWQNPASIRAAERFLEQHAERRKAADRPSTVRAQTERMLERFCDVFDAAAADAAVSRRLALADTTVRIELADEEGLGVTLLLDRTPVEVLDSAQDAEVSLMLASVDLDRLWLDDFHLPMAIARGRVRTTGPVRQFLRVMPIVRGMAATERGSAGGARRGGERSETS